MKVSVIIPVYNVEDYIERCVISLFEQTIKEDIEFIFIDDNSSDKSVEIISKTLDRYPDRKDQVKLIKNKQNQGVSIARNVGLSKAIGDYITFVDSDDFVSPQYIEHLLIGTLQESCGLVQAGFITKSLTVEDIVKCTDKELLTNNGDIILTKIRGLVYSKLFLRNIIVTHGIEFSPELTLAEDLCFVLDYIYHIDKVRFIEAADYNYVIRNGSASRKIHKFTYLYSQIAKEYDLILRLKDKWPEAYAGFNYRLTLLAKSTFNLLSNLYQNNTNNYIISFLSDFPKCYINILKYYPKDKLLKKLVARLAYREHWTIINIIFKLKKFLNKNL